MSGREQMNMKQLEQYTKNSSHHGVNSASILHNFIRYIQMCSDPYNIFRFMEEKAICTFLPYYWIRKAQYFAEIGEFNQCFECMQEAQSRSGIIQEESQKSININKKHIQLLHRMINEMKLHPLKSKRSVEEFQLLSNTASINSIQDKVSREKYQKLLAVYQQKYGALRKEKAKIFRTKTTKLGLSWLAEIYQKQEIQQKKIQQKIHQNSVRMSRQVKYHSMHTPLKFRDPQRLTRTMDSVQIMRKKRSTNQKQSRKRRDSKEDNDQDELGVQKSYSKMISSVPVGKSFSNLKRRVTFDTIRGNKNEDSQTQQEEGSNFIKKSKKKVEIQATSSNQQVSREQKSLPNPPLNKYE